MPRPSDPALLDPVTGLSNERHFRILYDFAFAAGDRGIPLTLALMTLEGDPGNGEDPAIQRLGALLAGSSREMDVVAHLGDGRFLALLMDCNLQGALVYADRVAGLVDALEDEWNATLTLGLATYRKGMEEPEELLELVRRCLEAAAQESGDRRIVTPRDL